MVFRLMTYTGAWGWGGGGGTCFGEWWAGGEGGVDRKGAGVG